MIYTNRKKLINQLLLVLNTIVFVFLGCQVPEKVEVEKVNIASSSGLNVEFVKNGGAAVNEVQIFNYCSEEITEIKAIGDQNLSSVSIEPNWSFVSSLGGTPITNGGANRSYTIAPLTGNISKRQDGTDIANGDAIWIRIKTKTGLFFVGAFRWEQGVDKWALYVKNNY